MLEPHDVHRRASIIIPGRFAVRIEGILVCEEGGGRKLNAYRDALVTITS